MVRGLISTYHLRSDRLEAYLQSQFPNFTAFNVQLSADGKQFYTFETPEALTQEQKDDIEQNVKSKPHDELDSLG